MKRFILEVPEDKGVTLCADCPWEKNENVCQYCCENDFCIECDFSKANLSEEK